MKWVKEEFRAAGSSLGPDLLAWWAGVPVWALVS